MKNRIGARIPPGKDNLVSVAGQIDELRVKWLAEDKICAMHAIGRGVMNEGA